MSLNPGAILNSTLKLTVNTDTLAPSQQALPINIPLNFANATNVEVITGSFTPANNQKIIASAKTVNFILFLCDLQTNITVASVLESDYIPCSRIAMWSQKRDAANPISSITLDGRTVSPDPMAQGVQVNYTCIIALVDVT